MLSDILINFASSYLGIATISIGVLYVIWRLFCYDPVKLYYQKNKLNCDLLSLCPLLSPSSVYRYPIWGASGFIMSMYGAVIRRGPKLPKTREGVLLKDGQTAFLDFFEPADKISEDAPIVMLVPGISGSSENDYAKYFAYFVNKQKWRCVIYNRVGCGTTQLTNHKLNMFGKADDLHECIQFVHNKYPNAPLFGVGISLGGNLLCNYVGRYHHSPLLAAVSCSHGYNVSKGLKHLKTRKFYDRHLTKKLSSIVLKHKEHFQNIPGIDLEKIKQVDSVADFDKHFTCIIEGLDESELDRYYEEASSSTWFCSTRRPLLLVHNYDDPLLNEEFIPFYAPQTNDNIMLVTTEHGGHCTWTQGFIVPESENWFDRLYVEFVHAALKKKNEIKAHIDKLNHEAEHHHNKHAQKSL